MVGSVDPLALAALGEALQQPPAMKAHCDCIASGNAHKPKQHGADPHAKNCAIYHEPLVIPNKAGQIVKKVHMAASMNLRHCRSD